MGSGSTAVAAIRTHRHYIGFDNDASYVDAARERAEQELRLRDEGASAPDSRVRLPAAAVVDEHEDLLARSVREGRQARDIAEAVLTSCGFTNIRVDAKLRGLGIDLHFIADDQTGGSWAFDVSGSFSAGQSGLRRSDTLWKALGKAAVLHESDQQLPLVLLSTSVPTKGSAGLAALKVVRGPGKAVYDVVQLLDPADHERLRSYALEGRPDR